MDRMDLEKAAGLVVAAVAGLTPVAAGIKLWRGSIERKRAERTCIKDAITNLHDSFSAHVIEGKTVSDRMENDLGDLKRGMEHLGERIDGLYNGRRE